MSDQRPESAHQGDATIHSELAEQLSHLGLDRVDRDAALLRDLREGAPLTLVLRHRGFHRGERRGQGAMEHAAEEHRGIRFGGEPDDQAAGPVLDGERAAGAEQPDEQRGGIGGSRRATG